MIYNNRHWFAKGDLRLEYSFAGGANSAIYDMATNETDMLFLSQEDALRKYIVADRAPASILAFKSQKIAYDYGQAYYLKFLMYNYGGSGASYVYSSNGTLVSSFSSAFPSQSLGTKKSTDNSRYYAKYKADYSMVASIFNYANTEASTFTLYNITAVCSVGTDAYFVGNEYGLSVRFRKYSAPTTNLAYPAANLNLTKLTLSDDGTKIYGIEGSYPFGWDGGSTVYVYTIASNTWASISLPTNHKGFHAIEYNGSLFVTGYNTVTGKAALMKYNGSTFDQLRTISNTRLYCAEVFNSILYIGGADGSIYSYTEE